MNWQREKIRERRQPALDQSPGDSTRFDEMELNAAGARTKGRCQPITMPFVASLSMKALKSIANVQLVYYMSKPYS